MAKKAQAKKAQGKTAKKANTATKHTRLAKTATGIGRALGRAAKGAGKVKAAVKKTVSGTRGKKKPKLDPEVEAANARNRALWKSQAREAQSVELAKHGSLVDERARVRAVTGVSWSNRKPR